MFDKAKRQISVKLSAFFFTILMLPLLCISAFFLHTYTELSRANAIEVFEDNHNNLKNAFTAEIGRLKTITNLLARDPELFENISLYQSGTISRDVCEERISSIVRTVSPAMAYNISPNIALFDEKGTLLGRNCPLYCYGDESVIEYIIDDVEKYKGVNQLRWVVDDDITEKSASSSRNVYVYRALSFPGKSETTCVCILKFKGTDLYRLYYSQLIDSQNVYIISPSGTLISEYEDFGISSTLEELGFEQILETFSTVFDLTVGERSVRIYNDALDQTGWHLISVYDSEKYATVYKTTGQMYLFWIILCAGGALWVASKGTKYFMKPIVELRNQMESVKRGDLTVRSSVKAKDEIGDLSAAFNHAVERISVLMDDLLAEQEKKRKADIMALQAQINPHFIGNTLATIRYLIYNGNYSEADKAITDLSKILRYAINDPDKIVTINFEMDLLKTYISILELGFGDDFQYYIDIPDEIGDCFTMKLLLQPIVENAILHGLKPLKGTSILHISGVEKNGDIWLSVIDNGVGFNQDEAKTERACKLKDSIGIENVDQRIKLHFGEKYGVLIESEPGKGTTVYVVIPKISGEEGDKCYENTIGG